MLFARYAIFFTPSPGPLADFGTAWLGWDATTGQTHPPPDIPGLPLPWQEITKTPRRYGFHGTLKPPFPLARGHSEQALHDALVRFCAGHAAVSLDGLELAQLGRFLALVPVSDSGPLNALAAKTVRAFDAFRAPPTKTELARWRRADLTPAQDALLVQWGYPYVMQGFRFHLTLTGKLPKAKTTQLLAILQPHLAPLLPKPCPIDALSLMGEAPDGRFHLIDRLPLSGEP